MRYQGSDPREGNMGLLRPSRWDGRGLDPYFIWAVVAALLLAGATLLLAVLVAVLLS